MLNKIKNYLRKHLPPNWILFSHKLRGMTAAFWYRFPARNLIVVGVTGTNGKTTTCHLIAEILEQAGYKVGMATTIDFKIGHKIWPNETKMTMISPFALQKLLREMVKSGCQIAIIETTSHAIQQCRNWGIEYKMAVLTNITHEHLDYHPSFADYRQTKMKLFEQAKVNVINLDDPSASYFVQIPTERKITYGLKNNPDVSARKILAQPQGTLFTLVTPKGQVVIDLKLPGQFNIANALAASAAAIGLDVKLESIKNGLEKVKEIKGRMEKIIVPSIGRAKQDFTVIVDYAHTPDALEKIYQTIVDFNRGRIIAVFGSCGDRDKTKRPIMGAIAGRLADYIIVTNEDPYTEDPQAIIDQVASGVPRGATPARPKKEGLNWWKIPDRRQAIEKAIKLAQKDDIVLITGKGAEVAMVWGDKKLPWSDQKEASRAISKKLNSQL